VSTWNQPNSKHQAGHVLLSKTALRVDVLEEFVHGLQERYLEAGRGFAKSGSNIRTAVAAWANDALARGTATRATEARRIGLELHAKLLLHRHSRSIGITPAEKLYLRFQIDRLYRFGVQYGY
jgi:hypothetical protein